MKGRCLIVTAAEPSASGAPAWRRFLMLADHYAASGLTVFGLNLHTRPIPQRLVPFLRDAVAGFALAPFDQARTAIERMDRRWAFDVVHLTVPNAPLDLLSGCAGVRLADLPDSASLKVAPSVWVAERRRAVDLFITFERDEATLLRETGAPFVRAAHLGRAARLSRTRPKRAELLAGCWVEPTPRAIEAVSAFLDQVRQRGGGAAPRFVVAGPGAVDVILPDLPVPVVRQGDAMAERVFYRGIDVAICPDLAVAGGDTPVRYDVVTALELGATPLVSASALTGLRESWRLPWFDDLYAMAEYVFERGHDLRDGGLLADLRARADWTWSGLTVAAGQQRTALMQAIADARDNKTRDGDDTNA